jgi:hypothetical protein
MNHKSSILLAFSLAVFLCLAGGQTRPAGKAAPAVNPELTALAQKQFGKTFTVPAAFPTTLITADFDGDGVQDVVIVADSKEPIPDSVEFNYRVADPYNAYFGMSDPNMNAAFSSADPKRNHALLVIFGAGAEAWRAEVPKAKFVIVNLPFDTIETGRMLVKKNKPPIFVIKAREAQVMDSAVFWEEKKKRWRWEPGGMPN